MQLLQTMADIRTALWMISLVLAIQSVVMLMGLWLSVRLGSNNKEK